MSLTYLERPVYGFGQVDWMLGLTGGTSRRWIDGYERGGRRYEPVVREAITGSELVTWGEFVETRLLAHYRDSGVPMQRMRGVVDGLRRAFQVRYPLATIRPFLDEERRVVYEVQETEGLEESMKLVVEAHSGQLVLASEVRRFRLEAEFEADEDGAMIATRLHPLGQQRNVVIDPLRGFGEAVVRSTSTQVLAELVAAGESIEWVASQYELPVLAVLDALEYERRNQTQAA
jgi:uncharacterized protein (DUF433 family)